MNEKTKQNVTKKHPPRGRPKGSAKFEKTDIDALTKVADALVKNKHLTVTKVLRQLDFDDAHELHRLRRRWRKHGEVLLQQANDRYQAEKNRQLQNIADYFTDLGKNLGKKDSQYVSISQFADIFKGFTADIGKTTRVLGQIDFSPILSKEFQNLSVALSAAFSTVQREPEKHPVLQAKPTTDAKSVQKPFKSKGDEYYAESLKYYAKAKSEWEREAKINVQNETNDE